MNELTKYIAFHSGCVVQLASVGGQLFLGTVRQILPGELELEGAISLDGHGKLHDSIIFKSACLFFPTAGTPMGPAPPSHTYRPASLILALPALDIGSPSR